MDNWTLWYITAKGVRAAMLKHDSDAGTNTPSESSMGQMNIQSNLPFGDPMDITQRFVSERTFEMPSLTDDARESSRVYVSR